MSDREPRFRDDMHHDGPHSGREASHAGETRTESRQAGRDVWRASASFGWLIGTGLLLLCGAGVVVLLARVPASSGGQRVAWIAIAAALTALVIGIAVLLRALPTMRYRFAGDALVVEWLGQQRIIALAEITDITFEPAKPLRLPRWEPFWPGYYVATVRTPAGVWHSWATQRPHRRVRLTTAGGIVAISPERPVRFIAELERRRQLVARSSIDAGSTPESVTARPVASPWTSAPSVTALSDTLPPAERLSSDVQHQSRPSATDTSPPRRPPASRNPIIGWLLTYRDLFRDQFLADQFASALVAAGVILPVLMVAYLYSQYEGVPDQVAIQWDAAGDVAERTGPSGLWRFPRIAVVILVVNTALATLLISIDRHLARLLVSGIPLAQVILFIALVRAVI